MHSNKLKIRFNFNQSIVKFNLTQSRTGYYFNQLKIKFNLSYSKVKFNFNQSHFNSCEYRVYFVWDKEKTPREIIYQKIVNYQMKNNEH